MTPDYRKMFASETKEFNDAVNAMEPADRKKFLQRSRIKKATEFMRAVDECRVILPTIRPYKAGKKTGRNEECTCGSGKKYKHCCLPTADPFRG